jgi:hypothetical protein
VDAPSSNYEKLGYFYVGRRYDVATRQRLDAENVFYRSKDLVNHAVCVGMTGSGKTGLGITLLEEAAIDRIPALIIDPKGDMANLMLAFDDLSPTDFREWINPIDAERAGLSPAEYAAREAEAWRVGLAEWDQNPERIKRLKAACEFEVYTPGSEAGRPISIVSSLAMPRDSVTNDPDLLHDRLATTATSLLTLLGIDADPLRSRDHILLTTILNHCWERRMPVDLEGLIGLVQSPPVERVGMMDLEAFFPAKDRFALAMSLNNLLAAPGFTAWVKGEPLDVGRLLYADDRPRMSIIYLAHLSEAERMFFLPLLLHKLLEWVRTQSGTQSLRAILYIDELFGFLPPVAEPPTKKPLLTLLKQARGYGLGVALATQNPVDLDYKGLSNTGTWFLGRLQTEQDKERVLDGVQGAVGGTESWDRAETSRLLSALGKRVFLMHNVQEPGPFTFETRWTLSYLAGPLTRDQIRKIRSDRGSGQVAATESRSAAPAVAPTTSATPLTGTAQTSRPLLPAGVSQWFLAARRPVADPAKVIYEPRLLALGTIHFVDTRKGLSADGEVKLLAPFGAGLSSIAWEDAYELALGEDQIEREPPPDAALFAALPADASNPKNYVRWKRELAGHLYRTRIVTLLRCDALQEYSRPGESERDFRLRLADLAREERDELVDQLKQRYETRLRTAEERLRKAALRVEREKQQAHGARVDRTISLGATLLSVLLGHGRLSTLGRATTTARGFERAARQDEDVRRARADADAYAQQVEDLEQELQREVAEIQERFDCLTLPLAELKLRPRRSDIDIRELALAWCPFGEDAAGGKVALFL